MPSWMKDEKTWEKAKHAVGDKYGDSDRHWAIVTSVYKKMGGDIKKSAKHAAAKKLRDGR